MSRKIRFRKTHTYDTELANIRKTNPELAKQIEEKREYFEHFLTAPPYRPAPGLNVEVLEGKITRPEWLKEYPKLHSFRVNRYARVIFWWCRGDGSTDIMGTLPNVSGTVPLDYYPFCMIRKSAS